MIYTPLNFFFVIFFLLFSSLLSYFLLFLKQLLLRCRLIIANTRWENILLSLFKRIYKVMHSMAKKRFRTFKSTTSSTSKYFEYLSSRPNEKPPDINVSISIWVITRREGPLRSIHWIRMLSRAARVMNRDYVLFVDRVIHQKRNPRKGGRKNRQCFRSRKTNRTASNE